MTMSAFPIKNSSTTAFCAGAGGSAKKSRKQTYPNNERRRASVRRAT